MIFCLDLETTGVGSRAGVIEIGGCWLHPCGGRSGEFFRKCRPESDCEVEEEALAVNGYTVEQVFDKERMTHRQAAAELIGFIRGGVEREAAVQIAAWNTPFEARFLRQMLEASSAKLWPFRNRFIDPQAILTADLIRGHRPPSGGGPRWDHAVEDAKDPESWGGLVKNSDYADAELLGIPLEQRPHSALNGARQTRARLLALGFENASRVK